jgi:pimeloyl-ACP methyl ester carboxylesterase
VELNHHRRGAGEPLVLLHGIGSRWQVWSPVLDRLAADREVVALDLPGFGDSPMPPPGTEAGSPSLTTLVLEFLGALGIERPHVAGNSLGGLIAIELAKRGAVRSVTALSPGGFYNWPESVYARVSLQLTMRSARRFAPRAERLLSRPGLRRLFLNQTFAHPERVPTRDAVETVRAFAAAPWFEETLIAVRREHFAEGERIEVPVTIAWGEKDRLLPPRQAQRAAQQIPRAKLVTLTDCGHVPMYDDPEQVARVLLEGSAPV